MLRIAVALAIVMTPLAAQTPGERFRAATGAPGVGIALSVGAEVRIETAGLRSVGGDPIADEDAWHLGSLTKSMTALLIARAVEAGTVDWEDAVAPDLSLEQLLTHTGGVPTDLPLFHRLRYLAFPGTPRSDRARYAAWVLAQSRPTKPGFAYSNAGYVLAAHHLESVTGRAWETAIIKEVFAPLGLSSAGFGPPDHIQGHSRGRSGDLVPADPQSRFSDNIVAMNPAGRVHMSLSDLTVYLQAVRDRSDVLVLPATWTRLLTPSVEASYAMGWNVTPSGFAHAGSNTLWYATVFVWPELDATLVLTANAGPSEAVEAAFEETARALQTALLGGAGLSAFDAFP